MDDLQPERPDVKPERSEWGWGRGDGHMDRQTDGWRKVLCATGFFPHQGCRLQLVAQKVNFS